MKNYLKDLWWVGEFLCLLLVIVGATLIGTGFLGLLFSEPMPTLFTSKLFYLGFQLLMVAMLLFFAWLLSVVLMIWHGAMCERSEERRKEIKTAVIAI